VISGTDGAIRCWQQSATTAAGSASSASAWAEVPALWAAADNGADAGGVGSVQHLWLASQAPPLLGARLDGGRIILWDLQR
jgi:hypothetical protein